MDETRRERPEQQEHGVAEYLRLLDAVAAMQMGGEECLDRRWDQRVLRPGHQVLPGPVRVDVDLAQAALVGSKRARDRSGSGTVGQQDRCWQEGQDPSPGQSGGDEVATDRSRLQGQEQAGAEEGRGEEEHDEGELVIDPQAQPQHRAPAGQVPAGAALPPAQ